MPALSRTGPRIFPTITRSLFLSAGIYTQTTDVECELNGIMTYDRAVVKVDENRFWEINLKVRSTL